MKRRGERTVPRGTVEQWREKQSRPRERSRVYGERWGVGGPTHRFSRYGHLHAHRVVRICKQCGQPYRVRFQYAGTHWQQGMKRGVGKGNQRQVAFQLVRSRREETTHPRLCPACAALGK